jgi:hypothetical protein
VARIDKEREREAVKNKGMELERAKEISWERGR